MVFLYNLKLPEVSYDRHTGAVMKVYSMLGAACSADAAATAAPYVNKGSFIAGAVADSSKRAKIQVAASNVMYPCHT
jgi:hypothetical protein